MNMSQEAVNRSQESVISEQKNRRDAQEKEAYIRASMRKQAQRAAYSTLLGRGTKKARHQKVSGLLQVGSSFHLQGWRGSSGGNYKARSCSRVKTCWVVKMYC